MAWTSPMTFVGNGILTAAQLNTYLRDNMLLMAPNLATGESNYFMASGPNTLVERTAQCVRASGSVTATTNVFTDKSGGPAVTAETTTQAIVMQACRLESNTANAVAQQGYRVSGASTVVAGDTNSILLEGVAAGNFSQLCQMRVYTALTAGTNTFTCQYRTGGVGTATFSNRMLMVMPI